jgi:hypothetical protein
VSIFANAFGEARCRQNRQRRSANLPVEFPTKLELVINLETPRR